MKFSEKPVLFECEGDTLVGILSIPATACNVGIVVVVGGPQYRAGSHRQFVHLARHCAQQGIPVLRFDYRGMGDSEGNPRSFASVDADISAAVGTLTRKAPQVRHVVLWGLCDGASAALMAAPSIPIVTGVVAVNPWVRSEPTLNQAIVAHYYGKRLASWNFWIKLVTGKLDIILSLGEFSRRAASALSAGFLARAYRPQSRRASPSFQDRMYEGLSKAGPLVLIVLSGRDLTAQEFQAFFASKQRCERVLSSGSRARIQHLPGADHTFSSSRWRAEVERLSSEFALNLLESSQLAEGVTQSGMRT